MREALIGLGLAGTSCLALTILPPDRARGVAASLLTLIAAIYIGLALGSQGTLSLSRQIMAATVIIALALAGLWFNWWFIVAGLALHGVWDSLHHGARGHGVVPAWYVPFCAVYDVAVALFMALYFALGQ